MNNLDRHISDFEKLLLGIEQPETPAAMPPLRQGDACPKCGKGVLDYNAMLQLACPECGFVNGEAGGCT